jgi:hypothetical protein
VLVAIVVLLALLVVRGCGGASEAQAAAMHPLEDSRRGIAVHLTAAGGAGATAPVATATEDRHLSPDEDG